MQGGQGAAPEAGAMVRVWDPATRLGHWLLVLLLATCWWTATNGQMDLHRYSGFAVMGVLVFRLYWGFAGPETVRFSSFVKGPRAVWGYARGLPVRRPSHAVGHNPLGGLSVLALLTLMLGQVGLGLFAVDTDGLESGPLSSLVSFDFGRACAELHGVLFNVILGVVALHVAAVLFYLAYKRENLIAPMIVGRRRFPSGTPHPRGASLLRLIVGLALAAGTVLFMAKGLHF
jgi:cytochrome b